MRSEIYFQEWLTDSASQIAYVGMVLWNDGCSNDIPLANSNPTWGPTMAARILAGVSNCKPLQHLNDEPWMVLVRQTILCTWASGRWRPQEMIALDQAPRPQSLGPAQELHMWENRYAPNAKRVEIKNFQHPRWHANQVAGHQSRQGDDQVAKLHEHGKSRALQVDSPNAAGKCTQDWPTPCRTFL